MGEELIQRGYQKHGTFIGYLEYYDIGNSSLNQLKRKKIIPDKDYGAYSLRKPDGLLVDRRNKKQIDVLVTLEYKKPSEFRTDEQKKEATQQCNDVCQEIGSKIGVITDSQTTIWINPNQKNADNNYVDEKKKKRSYSIIRNEDKKDLTEPFIIQKKSEKDADKLDDDTKNTLFYIERILSCVNSSNSTLKATEEVDPLGLARSVWQDIYINTGKDPTKCLYNVVELFIFKFLSDLKVLRTPYNLQNLLKMYEQGNSNREVLRHYANVSRKEIVRLFLKGEDGTNIINGTIFVDSRGNPVESQANLFKSSLIKYDNFGTLRNIKKEFKTKLFETFLKQSHDKSRLGQFLTPRKIVRPMTEMAGVEDLPDGSRVCDPFCGVGGFLLEPLHKTKLRHRFEPKNGKINPKLTIHGFDKGSDGDEERTVILAKANMLIYMSDIVEKHPTLTEEFSRIFNETFHLLKESNLGTLKKVITLEEDKYDLILTNPPYITSGVSSIRDEIKAEGIEDAFTSGGKGVEGLALEWIIRSLKKSGKAFVVIPDSILNVAQNKGLRKYLLEECFLNCIISLPIKTFFNTPKKTYIIGFTKKQRENEKQDFPVFTYLVSNIGETLDVNRFEVEGKSDIEKAKELFNQYKGSPKSFVADDPRCKLQPIEKFEKEKHWSVDRWWSQKEKIDLGIMEENNYITLSEFCQVLGNISSSIKKYQNEVEALVNTKQKKSKKLKKVSLGNKNYFELAIGKRVLKRDIRNSKGKIPIFSANVFNPIGYTDKSNISCFDNDFILWGIDGDFEFNIKLAGHKFSSTDHCGTIEIKDKKIDPGYLLYALNAIKDSYGFDRNLRASLGNMKTIEVEIPDEDGEFDLKKQKKVANEYAKIEQIKKKLKEELERIEKLDIEVEIPKESILFMKISVLFDMPSINGLTKKFIQKNSGNIPVYGGKKGEEPIGYIKEDLDNVKYFENCLAWNREGSVGYVFWHKHKFTTNDHHRPLILKDEFKNVLDMDYLRFIIENILLKQGFQWSKTASKDKVSNFKIPIPVNDKNEFDLEKQKEVANKYNKIEQIKKKSKEDYENLISLNVQIIENK